MNNLAKNLRVNLSRILAARGISQRKLAKIMGISHPYISRIIAGQAIPTLAFVEKIADGLGIDARVILRNARKSGKKSNRKKFGKCS